MSALGQKRKSSRRAHVVRFTRESRRATSSGCALRLAARASRDAFLYAFDLLEINGDDLRRYEWHVRRATLASLIRGAGHGIQFSDHIDSADGEAVFDVGGPDGVREMGEVQTAARWLGIEVTPLEIRRADDILAAFAALKADALYVVQGPLVGANRTPIIT
jgi:hypothetical protein